MSCGLSNEALATLATAVQAGEVDMLTLWAQVRRYAWSHIRKWVKVAARAGLTAEDLELEAFVALLEAVEAWSIDRGPFLTAYTFKLKSRLTLACGVQTERARRDPLRCSPLSLDAPAPGDEDNSDLGELIQDPAAAAALEDVDELDRRERLHNVLEWALQQLSEAQRSAVVSRYYKGLIVDRATLSAALRALRHPRLSRPLRELWRG